MYNKKQVQPTLRHLVKILDREKIQYRLLGSVVTAAIYGRLHRSLGDIDLIVDVRKKNQLLNSLQKLGYKRAGGMFAFGRRFLALETLDHPTLLSVGYFVGKWKKDRSFVMGGNALHTIVESRGVVPSPYKLMGISFIGIPPGAVATGILSSKSNEKRKKEIKLLQEKQIVPLKNDYIHVRFLGIPLDFLYHGAMGLFNVLGNLRQSMGLPFDPWRSKIN